MEIAVAGWLMGTSAGNRSKALYFELHATNSAVEIFLRKTEKDSFASMSALGPVAPSKVVVTVSEATVLSASLRPGGEELPKELPKGAASGSCQYLQEIMISVACEATTKVAQEALPALYAPALQCAWIASQLRGAGATIQRNNGEKVSLLHDEAPRGGTSKEAQQSKAVGFVDFVVSAEAAVDGGINALQSSGLSAWPGIDKATLSSVCDGFSAIGGVAFNLLEAVKVEHGSGCRLCMKRSLHHASDSHAIVGRSAWCWNGRQCPSALVQGRKGR
jgi:hypothetical protein